MAFLKKTFELEIKIESDVSEADLYTHMLALETNIRHDLEVQRMHKSTIWTNWDESSKAVVSIDMIDM